MEASVDPQPRGPDWMPITPKTGSLFHAETHRKSPHALSGSTRLQCAVLEVIEARVRAFRVQIKTTQVHFLLRTEHCHQSALPFQFEANQPAIAAENWLMPIDDRSPDDSDSCLLASFRVSGGGHAPGFLISRSVILPPFSDRRALVEAGRRIF